MENITKRFGKVTANNAVNLELHEGEILSLLGENGSGKTTLMNMLSGIYFPDEGQIYIHGQPVTIGSPKDAFAHGIGTRIRSVRMQQKLSQEQLAAKAQLLGCDLTRSALAKIECGQQSIYPDELKALHLALNVPCDTLLP